MRRAVILHGTDGNPQVNWLPWAKAELEKRNYEVYVPLLPGNHTPNRQVYEKFLRESGWDFNDNLVIGHSSGATTLLNVLGADWFPAIDTAIFVGVFLNERLTKNVDWYEQGQFDNLFPKDGFDSAAIKQKAKHIYFIHGDDDPYCDIIDTVKFAKTLGTSVMTIKHGGHLSSNRKDLNELLEIIDRSQI